VRLALIRLLRIAALSLAAVLVLLLAAATTYGYLHRDHLFPRADVIVVYGRETCGITRRVRDGLASRGIPYVFADVDVPAIDDEMWFKLGPAFREPTITFPVVHVGGRILLTPSAEQVATRWQAVRTDAATRDYATFLRGARPVPHY
jgi:hypothetical protein